MVKKRITTAVPLQPAGAGRQADGDVRGYRARWSAGELCRRTSAMSTPGVHRTVSSTTEER